MDVLFLTGKVCTGALILQIIIGGSGTLRTDYPGLITLVGAFFFPVGLVSHQITQNMRVRAHRKIMLVLTGSELCTAHFSETISCALSPSPLTRSVHAHGSAQATNQSMGVASQLVPGLFR